MEYGTHFIWKLFIWKLFSAKLKYYTHSIIKLAFPDYQSSLSSNFLIYFSSKLPDFWPNVFTLQALCCKTSFSSFKLFIKTLKTISIQCINDERYFVFNRSYGRGLGQHDISFSHKKFKKKLNSKEKVRILSKAWEFWDQGQNSDFNLRTQRKCKVFVIFQNGWNMWP